MCTLPIHKRSSYPRKIQYAAASRFISNDHHPGTSMPSGGHPPHQLAALSFFIWTQSFIRMAAPDRSEGTQK